MPHSACHGHDKSLQCWGQLCYTVARQSRRPELASRAMPCQCPGHQLTGLSRVQSLTRMRHRLQPGIASMTMQPDNTKHQDSSLQMVKAALE